MIHLLYGNGIIFHESSGVLRIELQRKLEMCLRLFDLSCAAYIAESIVADTNVMYCSHEGNNKREIIMKTVNARY